MKKLLIISGLLVPLLAVAVVIRNSLYRNPPQPASQPLTSSAAGNLSTADKLIKRAEIVSRVSPGSSEGFNLLGAAYIEKARETGDFSFNARAESALKRSLEVDPANFDAMKMRATLLLSYHKFAEALEATRQALKLRPDNATIYGAMTDALVELGRYDEAKKAAEKMLTLQPDSSAYCRISYLRALHGDAAGAIEAMQQAVRYARPRDFETIAWARVHLGDELLNAGRPADAETQYDLALEALPDYHLALSGKARARLRAGDIEGAVSYYQKSQARVPLPDTVIALGDLLTVTGRTEEARKQYELLEFIEGAGSSGAAGATEATTYSRQLAMYYANHDLQVQKALTIARQERAVRADVYTCDALAWCLFKNHLVDEARQAITEALRLGTRDAQIHYHAGLIYQALGDREKALKHLRIALEINPTFDALQAERARQAHAEMAAGG